MAERARGNVAEFTVTELSGAIKRAMEENFGYVRLRGEISGYRGPHSSGHAYFALKDDRAKIEAVVWKGVFGSLAFKPEEGLEVIATGKVSTFPGTSKYQIVIERLEPAGAGALMALLEERKKKLAAEGLFDEARKKPLPFLPQIVGIVTSPTGAVIRDMLHGFTERFPMHVILWPVRCQGETCAAEVSAAIRGFNALAPGGRVARPDVLIVARGGGAIEDLWGYNEEIVVRAVAASDIPVISAVGHETDWTLIDLVADARAPTPTKAAEWAAPKYSELLAKTSEIAARLNAGVFRQVEAKRASLKSASRGLPRLQDLLSLPRQRFDATASRLERSLSGFASASRSRANVLCARLTPRLLTARLDRANDRLAALDSHVFTAFARGLQKRRIAFAQPGNRLQPGLLRHPIHRAGDRLSALENQLCTMYERGVQKRRAAFARPSGRLQPGLLRYPAERGRDRLDAQSARASRGFAQAIGRRRQSLSASAQLLNSLGYKNVLERGFTVVRDGAGAMVRRTEAALLAGALEIQFADGRVAAHTGDEVVKMQPAPSVPIAKQRANKQRDQGSLL